ncbi:MAG: CRISPR-associated protein, Csh2 family [Promethearchaeota archaeon]|nr:MAG: CRISPR-associated protein, Csh2 family [Candidatus Lokiarchaeota archaeon]
MSKNNLLENRHEIVFMYDVRDANPNGDPDNSNMPRMDDETEQNIVTDVRLKRTIRDFWLENGEKILVRAETNKEGNRKTMDDLATEFLNMGSITKSKAAEARAKLATDLPKEFIDVRSFGAAVTLSNANYSITGTVQFGLGRSLNKPLIKTKTITATLASTEEKGQGTFGEYHIVDYSLINFHGIASEINAIKTMFTREDLNELFRGMWMGTKQLNTRSKFNHMPRLLMDIESKKGKSQIGDLDLGFILKENEINSVEEARLDISTFIERIEGGKENIDSINLLHDDALALYDGDEMIQNIKNYLSKKFSGITVDWLDFQGE